jgi:putative ABC transport system ATP-binding protein
MLEAIDIRKTYQSEGVETTALDGVSLRIESGEFVSVIGRSGSGKSTLLSIMSTLQSPDGGEIHYEGKEITSLGPSGIDRIRRADFAVIFQFHHLLPYFTALENTLLPFMQGFRSIPTELRDKARASLARVGLTGKEDRLPGQLSGGEQQRVAIARALVKDARVLFADEPTGSLDKKTATGVMELLCDLNADGLTTVMVTHEPASAAMAQRIVEMEDGRIVDTPDKKVEKDFPSSPEMIMV